MGKVKAYLEHVLNVLQISHEEVEGMSLAEIDTLLTNHEHSLKESVDEINNAIQDDEDKDKVLIANHTRS